MASATTDDQRRPPRWRPYFDIRTRILLSNVLLLAIAALVSVVAVRHVQLVRLDDRISEALAQETREFRSLADGTDPETGRPFGSDVDRLFEVYLDQNVPGEGEQLLTVPRRGRPLFDASERGNVRLPTSQIGHWRQLRDSEHGELETPLGPARYLAIPVRFEGRALGAFVVAYFVAGERAEVDEAVRIVAAAAAAVLVMSTLAAFLLAGRTVAPIRELRQAASSITASEMTARIAVEGHDDVAALGHTFNHMVDRLAVAFAQQRDFIRDISHELRTPIAVVRGHLELLSEIDPANRRDRDLTIGLVTGELDRMTRFVEELLLLAQSEQPNFLALETVRVGDLCAELLHKVRPLANREWRLEASTGNTIVADPQRLTQALMNLTRNAIEHTDQGAAIEIGASVTGDYVSIWVSDGGVGIQPEDERRIFERFTRGHGAAARYRGSGIGLAIVRAIAEAHDGRVELDNRLGAGSRFTITLPVEGPAAAATRAEPES